MLAHIYDSTTTTQNTCLHMRRLRKSIERYMPVEHVKAQQELVPGGDIRIKGNMWLRKAWEKCKVVRVLREAEVRKLVRHMDHRHNLCSQVASMGFGLTFT
jgi:hypothetical protein